MPVNGQTYTLGYDAERHLASVTHSTARSTVRSSATTAMASGDNATLVIGQPTATSGALNLIGTLLTVGIVDAFVDEIGSAYAAGKIGGIYDFFGVTGGKVPLYSGAMQTPLEFHTWFYLQLGDH